VFTCGSRVQKNPGIFKKAQPGCFFGVLSGFIGFWVLLVFFWTCSASGCLSKHGKGKCMTEDLLFIS